MSNANELNFQISQGTTTTVQDTVSGAEILAMLSGATVEFVFQGEGALAALVFTCTGSVADAAAGKVAVVIEPESSGTPGFYLGQWKITKTGVERRYPVQPLRFEVVASVPVTPPSQISLVSEMYEPIWAVLGDVRRPHYYEEDAVASVVRSVIRMGQLPGYQLTASRQGITPAIVNSRDFALLSYKAAKMLFMPDSAAYSYRTRAISEKFGEQRMMFFDLEEAIRDLEDGEMFRSFQSYYSWINSIAGMDVWSLMTKMNVNAPVATVTLGRAGIQVNMT